MNIYKLIIVLFILISTNAYPSFLEDFAASTRALGNAGQADLLNHRASNNYYMPASLAFNEIIQIEGSSFVSLYNIDPINNIVIENSINTEDGAEKLGTIENDFSSLIINSIHLSLPIERINASINFSVISPFPYAAQFNSGDPYTPEYSLLKARPRRPQGFFNFAYALNNSLSFSLGAHLGAKTESNIFTKAAVNNQGETTLYTYASGAGEVTPKLAPVVSLFYRTEKWSAGLYFQGEMESNLKVDLVADEISTGIIFDSIIESVLFYDPQIAKLQLGLNINNRLKLHSSVNYYIWKDYQTPKINITQLAVMTGTYNYETLQLQNSISAKIAVNINILDNLTYSVGGSFEQSPITGDFSENGNTIHSDTYTASMGVNLDFRLLNYDLSASIAGSYKMLKDKSVIKSPGQENGQNGRKIGAPGYDIGGNITTVSLGLGLSI